MRRIATLPPIFFLHAALAGELGIDLNRITRDSASAWGHGGASEKNIKYMTMYTKLSYKID
jgi:hypothetical protein